MLVLPLADSDTFGIADVTIVVLVSVIVVVVVSVVVSIVVSIVVSVVVVGVLVVVVVIVVVVIVGGTNDSLVHAVSPLAAAFAVGSGIVRG